MLGTQPALPMLLLDAGPPTAVGSGHSPGFVGHGHWIPGLLLTHFSLFFRSNAHSPLLADITPFLNLTTPQPTNPILILTAQDEEQNEDLHELEQLLTADLARDQRRHSSLSDSEDQEAPPAALVSSQAFFLIPDIAELEITFSRRLNKIYEPFAVSFPLRLQPLLGSAFVFFQQSVESV